MAPSNSSHGSLNNLTIRRLGDDRRVRLTRNAMTALGVEAGDSVVFYVEDGAVYVRKATEAG